MGGPGGWTASRLSPDRISLLGDLPAAIWVAARARGVAWVRFHGETFTTYTERDGLTHRNVSVVRLDRDGSLWVGTWGGGLSHFKDGTFTTYTEANSDLSGKRHGIGVSCRALPDALHVGPDRDSRPSVGHRVRPRVPARVNVILTAETIAELSSRRTVVT